MRFSRVIFSSVKDREIFKNYFVSLMDPKLIDDLILANQKTTFLIVVSKRITSFYITALQGP